MFRKQAQMAAFLVNLTFADGGNISIDKIRTFLVEKRALLGTFFHVMWTFVDR